MLTEALEVNNEALEVYNVVLEVYNERARNDEINHEVKFKKHGKMNEIEKDLLPFVSTLKTAILHSQLKAAKAVNTQLVQLYFVLGAALSAKIKQANWGDKVLENVSKELQRELKGLKGFSAQNLKKMRLFYEAYPEQLAQCGLWQEINEEKELNFRSAVSNEIKNEIGSTVSNQFKDSFWSISFSNHFSIIIKTKTRETRQFYIEKTAKEGWSNRVLENHLKNKIHDQNKLPTNFDQTLTSSALSEKAMAQFKDEYLLDFINIEDADNERVIEDKIVHNIKNFILHMGKGFAFMGNQYRIEVEQEEFFIDLLFYNRQLQCLVAIELKRGKFKPEHLGQLSFYLNVLDIQVKLANENPSIGIVLCKEKNNTVVEYALRNSNQPMGVATFKTKQEMPINLQEYMPSAEDLKTLLNNSENE